MSDIRCAICGEPWDQYGIYNGDMETWEKDLFVKGAGCPSCEGHCQDGEDHAIEQAKDVMLNSEDPDSFDSLMDPCFSPPPWKKPDPIVLFTCEQCGVKLLKDANGDLEIDEIDVFAPRLQYHNPYDSLDPDNLEIIEIEGYKYCPVCITKCADCDTPILRDSSNLGEVDDAGYSFVRPGEEYDRNPDYLCIDCYEIAHSEKEHEEELENYRDIVKTLLNKEENEDLSESELMNLADSEINTNWSSLSDDERLEIVKEEME